MAKNIEIRAIFAGEFWRRDTFAIADARPTSLDRGTMPAVFRILGNSQYGELLEGGEYFFFGYWESHPKHGKGFKFSSFRRCEPVERSGIIRYLEQCKGVGQSIASAMWSKYGQDAVRMLRESPEIVAHAIPRLSLDAAIAAAEQLEHWKGLESCQIELMALINGYGFPRNTVEKAIQAWGARAVNMLKDDPYQIMRFRGCGFLRADNMYLKLGHPPGDLRRQAYCAWHTVASDMEGHTWLPADAIIRGLRERISGAEIDPAGAVKTAIDMKLLATRWDDREQFWIADARKANSEKAVAAKVVEMLSWERNWPDADHPAFDNLRNDEETNDDARWHQRIELAKAIAGSIGILTGLPGTGKTTAVASLVKAILDDFPAAPLAIVAPTGKAAMRASEAMQSRGIQISATTIHRLLGVKAVDGGEWEFEHGPDNPLPHSFIIVDEMSMVGTGLFAMLLGAIRRGTNLLLVGDINQLPPIEHGAPLCDLLDMIPTGRLTKIRRNSGTIVRACRAICLDEPIIPTDDSLAPHDAPPKNLKLIPATKGNAAERIIGLVRTIRETKAFDPIWDTQVIVAVNAKSTLARKTLNKLLQHELNPSGQGIEGSPFRVGDKLICLKNSQLPIAPNSDTDPDGIIESASEDSQPKAYVANGEFGRVLEVHEKKTIVEFQNPKRVVLVPRGRASDDDDDKKKNDDNEAGCDLDLGYACTCHKMQGSETACVIVALDEYPGATGDYGVCCREWAFTACSRGKFVKFLVGKMGTLKQMCRKVVLPGRKTFLVESLRAMLDDAMQLTDKHEAIEA
jgi:exodeoxyribonuclease V alpha subunit